MFRRRIFFELFIGTILSAALTKIVEQISACQKQESINKVFKSYFQLIILELAELFIYFANHTQRIANIRLVQ